MKKCILWILILCTMLLAACQSEASPTGGKGTVQTGGEGTVTLPQSTVPLEQETVNDRTYITLMGRVDENLAVIYNNTMIVTNYEYKGRLRITKSLDGASAVHRTYEGALLYIHDGIVETIVDYAESYRFSVDGNAIAFQISEEKAANAGMESGLYLYDVQTGQTVQVASAADGEVRSYALSPDGKTLAYVTKINYDGRLFIHQDGASTLRMLFDTNKQNNGTLYQLISINNGADIIYMHSTGSLISVDGAGNKTLVGVTNGQYVDDSAGKQHIFYLNADHSQLLFYNASTYLSVQGQEGTQISLNKIYPAQPAFANFHREDYTYTCNFEDLSKQLLGSQNKVRFWYPNASGEYAVVGGEDVEKSESHWLDPTGQHLFFRTQERMLYLVDLQNDVQITELANVPEAYAISHDGSTLYYATTFTHEYEEGKFKYSSYLYRCSAKDGSEQKKPSHTR